MHAIAEPDATRWPTATPRAASPLMAQRSAAALGERRTGWSRRALAALALAVLATRAEATGSLACAARDENVQFVAEAVLGRGQGGPLVAFGGRLELLGPAVKPDLRETALDAGHLTQRWLDEAHLKLRLYRERPDGPHGFVDLVVDAAAVPDEEGRYRGRYALTVFEVDAEATHRAGDVACTVE